MASLIVSQNLVIHVMIDAPGNANHVTTDDTDPTMIGVSLIMSNCESASAQFIWSGFNASDAVITIEASNVDLPSDYTQKSSATYTIPAGSGVNSFSLNEIITEKFYRVKYAKNSNSAGTLNVYFKGVTSEI